MEVKILSLSSLFYLTPFVFDCFEELVEKMAGEGTSMNPHPLRIDVVKFNSTNNFGMWRYEVMDALTTLNLEDTLQLEKKRASITEEDWDKMNLQNVA